MHCRYVKRNRIKHILHIEYFNIFFIFKPMEREGTGRITLFTEEEPTYISSFSALSVVPQRFLKNDHMNNYILVFV